MKINLTPTELIDQLRAWFHPKDRAIVIPTSVRAYNTSNGATLAMALIEEQVLTASSASITIDNIPQTFRSLLLMCQLRSDAAAESDSVLVRFNGDSGNNYDRQILLVNNATVTAGALRAQSGINIALCEGANSRASNWPGFEISILGYAQTDREKWALCPLSAAFGNVSADADLFITSRQGRWRSTVAITSVALVPVTGANFVSGSIVTLYGVL